jgi:hypothetical protein
MRAIKSGAKEFIPAGKRSGKIAIVVNTGEQKYFDRELARALGEIKLIYPRAREDIHVVRFKITQYASVRVLDLTTDSESFGVVLSSDDKVFEIICREMLIGTKCYLLSCPRIHLLSSAIECESIEQIFSHHYGITYYIPLVRDRYSDSTIISISGIVRELLPEQSISDGLKKIIAVTYGVEITTVMRDIRFEAATGFRYNQWLGTFELLPTDIGN